MLYAIRLFLASIVRLSRTRRRLWLENLALRQQLAVLKRGRPRPRLSVFDKVFWIVAQRFWSGWKQALIIVSPETVVRWHRSGFRLYWRAISRARRVLGRKRISKEVRAGKDSRARGRQGAGCQSEALRRMLVDRPYNRPDVPSLRP